MTTLEIRLKEMDRMTETTIKKTFAELQVGDVVLVTENGIDCEFQIQSLSKSWWDTMAKGILSDGYNRTYANLRFTGLVTCLPQEESMKA